MIVVTAAARDCLSKRLTDRNAAADEAMRFTRREGGWKLRMDRVKPTDASITHEGRKVLVLDNKVSKAMSDMTLDVKNTDDGTRLTLLRD